MVTLVVDCAPSCTPLVGWPRLSMKLRLPSTRVLLTIVTLIVRVSTPAAKVSSPTARQLEVARRGPAVIGVAV